MGITRLSIFVVLFGLLCMPLAGCSGEGNTVKAEKKTVKTMEKVTKDAVKVFD
jgi:hypothetical protein